MAYNNYNNNRNNGGYRNNNYQNNRNYNNGYKQYNQRPAYFNGFDATKYKKPDIDIKDLNGKIYRISGNFSTAFSAEIIKTIDRIEEIRKGSNDLNNFPEMFDLLKDWCLSLINMNTDGVIYTMADVNAGFNDIYVLYNLVGYISKVIGSNPVDTMRLGDSSVEGNVQEVSGAENK